MTKSHDAPDQFTEAKLLLANLKGFVLKNYLPLAFAAAFIVGLSWPVPGAAVLQPQVRGVHIVTFVNICIVFFISGMTLRTDELRGCFTRKTAAGSVFGLVSIIGITPLLAFLIREFPLTPPEYVTGLTIFCVVPTTLGVGVSLTNSAKGNEALAIFLTVASNVIGVALVPLWVKVMLSSSAAGVENITIDVADIFVKLLISNLVPTVIGKLVREFVPGALKFVRNHKVMLSLISNTNLAFIIWQTISGAQHEIVTTYFGTMLLVIITALFIHVVYLVFNSLVVVGLRVPLQEGVATVIMASQKSAPVAITTIFYITSDVTAQGLLSVPCVVGQLLQIFVGQPIANYLAGRVQRQQAKAKEAEANKSEKDVQAVPIADVAIAVPIEGSPSQQASS